MIDNKFEKLNTTLPADTSKLNNLLLTVELSTINFDLQYFKDGLKIENIELLSDQKSLFKLLTKCMPEWEQIISRKQHPTHEYTLDIHILLVLQKIKESSEFKTLNNYDKLALIYTALLHDIEKKAQVVDPEHPERGAETSYGILKRLGFNNDFVELIYKLIKNHQVIGLISSNKLDVFHKSITEIFPDIKTVELLKIFTIADIKSVKKKELFYNETIKNNVVVTINKLLSHF